MNRIPGYELIALAVGIAACLIMALGFAMTERFHKEHLERGTSRSKVWMFFALVMVVFIFLMTLACSPAEPPVWDKETAKEYSYMYESNVFPPMECKGWTFAIGYTIIWSDFDCDDSEWHYQYMIERRLDLFTDQLFHLMEEMNRPFAEVY